MGKGCGDENVPEKMKAALLQNLALKDLEE